MYNYVDSSILAVYKYIYSSELTILFNHLDTLGGKIDSRSFW